MSATVARPYDVPRTSGNGRAILLAVVVHLLLAVLLFFGVRWQSSEPAVVQAELWSPKPQTAAPAPPPQPPPPKAEVPVQVAKPEPEPPQPKADIVEKAPAKVEPVRKKEPVVKVEAPPKPQPRPQPVVRKVEPVKPPPKPVVEAPRRPSELSSLLAAADSETMATPSNGHDQQTSGPRGRDTYIGRLVKAIRSQMRYPASAPGNPYVTMRIEQLPNGEVVNVTATRPSGVPAFDDAVDRAIRAASPLPRDEQGKVERTLNLDYYMYEKN